MLSSIFKSLTIGAFLFASHASAEFNWDIKFVELTPDFTKDSINEIKLKYEIGTSHNRIQVDLFQKGCTAPIQGTTIDATTTTTPTPTGDPNFDDFEVLLDLDKTTIASSNIWNVLSKEVELCIRLRLLSELNNVTAVMREDSRDIKVYVNFEEDFDADADASFSQAYLTSVSVSTTVDNYIQACTCDATSFNCNTEVFLPYSTVNICIKSLKKEDMYVGSIESLLVSQGDKQLQLISGNWVVNEAITSKKEISDGFIVASLIPSEFFSYGMASTANVTGVAFLQLPIRRRLDDEITGYPGSTRAMVKRFGDEVSTFVINLQLEKEELGAPIDVDETNNTQMQSGLLACSVPIILSIAFATMCL
jgi:hypothetical protein